MTSSLSQQAREKLAREYLAERAARSPNVTPSRTYVNSTIRERLTAIPMGTSRDGANDFRLINSAPIGAQIRRTV